MGATTYAKMTLSIKTLSQTLRNDILCVSLLAQYVSLVVLSVVMLNYSKLFPAWWHYPEKHYTDRLYVGCHYGVLY